MIHHRFFKDLPRAEEFIKESGIGARIGTEIYCGLDDSPTKQDYIEMLELFEGYKDSDIASIMPYMVKWLE